MINILYLALPNTQSLDFWLEFGLSTLLVAALVVFVWLLVRRWFARIFFTLGAAIFEFALFFSFSKLAMASILFLVFLATLITIANVGDFRVFAANALKGKKLSFFRVKGKSRNFKVFDKEAFYHDIFAATTSLSKSKTGAIMTFEKKNPLNDFIKNGTMVNAPVSSELLVTIFYPGTRLHDGAVVIRDNVILAASVYYTATTKPLSGKFGSRHRAAIGISEITDSVTIVVSEETGRISIACAGELESVSLDNFPRIFREYMEDDGEK